MSDQPAETAGDEPVTPPPTTERRVRRTTLSTGFSDVPGKTCAVCGYEGFRFQTTCPEGHPLS